jgi:predicted phage terminase large subunit-like protein
MQSTLEELVYHKFLCEESTLDFTRYFFKAQFSKKFIIGEHHQKICDALDKVVKGEIKKLIINIAPRYGKTELAVKNFIAYGLAINPASKFIHLSYSDDLALDNSEGVKDIVASPEYQQMFPKVKFKRGSDSKKKWYTTEGGGVYATAAAGQVTGFGAGTVDDIEEVDMPESSGKFSGAMIIDDPIKPEDADSDVIRNRVNQRWDSTIKNRVNSRNTTIIVIMQRLHENDLCGYLQKQSPGEWTVLSFPCLREDGTSLWPFKHTPDELQKMKRENEVVFERQYQQEPKPLEGILFKKHLLKRFRKSDLKNTGLEATIGYCDVKDEGTDYFSSPWGKLYPGKVYITDAIFNQDTVDITVPQTAATFNRLNAEYVRVERNNQGGGFIRDLKRLVPEERVHEVVHSKSKFSRIYNEYTFIMQRCYFLHDDDIEPGSEYEKFLDNLCSYMKDGTSSVDDAPDSMAGLARFAQSVYAHLFE